MKILVTGGLGAIGAHLVRHLRSLEHEVWITDRPHAAERSYIRCDMGVYRQVEHLFEAAKFDLVYHLAGEFGRNNGEDFYETLWHSNAIGVKNILRCQEKHGFRMVFASSSEVYGDWDGLMSEEVMDEQPIRQMNDYAISKWVNELQILNSADRFGTETVRVRFFNVYGPGEYYSDYRSVICQFIYRALHDLPYTVYLNHKRTSCFIEDTVVTLGNIIDNFKPGEVYNIAGEQYHDIKSLSDMILAHLGKDDHLVTYLPTEAHNTRNKLTTTAKAKRDLDHNPKTSLEEGIPRTIEWQKEVYGLG